VPQPTGLLVPSVDRAAFVVALGQRLRRAGVPVSFTSLGACTEALGLSPPADVPTLYWLCRVTMVHRADELVIFDAVFDAVFRDAGLAIEGQASGPSGGGDGDDQLVPVRAEPTGTQEGAGLPWHTLPSSMTADAETAQGQHLPEPLPSALDAIADTPFDQLDESDLALVGALLEKAWQRWPMRRSRRHRAHPSGRLVALRETIARSRRTGWEPVELVRTRSVPRPRSLTMVVDVSQSMQPYATAYLHLMRVLARSGRAETFAFSTHLTRLTPSLRHRSAPLAMRLATEQVVDRYGGTRLATSLSSLVSSRHGNALRGGVLVVASDGWDSDDPEQLARVLARISLRAHRVVWLNPRAAAPGFQPLVGSMAAALPFCDDFVPANTIRAIGDALDAILAD
jgi:uncharacterized protein with von Willebrand factor type A (vWA) domain